MHNHKDVIDIINRNIDVNLEYIQEQFVELITYCYHNNVQVKQYSNDKLYNIVGYSHGINEKESSAQYFKFKLQPVGKEEILNITMYMLDLCWIPIYDKNDNTIEINLR